MDARTYLERFPVSFGEYYAAEWEFSNMEGRLQANLFDLYPWHFFDLEYDAEAAQLRRVFEKIDSLARAAQSERKGNP